MDVQRMLRDHASVDVLVDGRGRTFLLADGSSLIGRYDHRATEQQIADDLLHALPPAPRGRRAK